MTVRPDDFAVMSPVGGLFPIQSYRIEKPPCIVGKNGQLEACADYIPLLRATAEDPDGFRRFTFTHPSGDQQILDVSLRACAVTKWTTVIAGRAPVSWMSRGTSIGGNGLGPNARRFAFWGTPQQEEFNPTMGGANRVPYMQGPYHTGKPIYMAATPSKVEGATVPPEWELVDPEHPILAWRERQFLRVEPFWTGLRHVHRVTYWEWHPDGWMQGQGMDPVLTYSAVTPHMRGRMFDYASFADLDTGAISPITGWNPPVGVSLRKRWNVWKSGMLITDADGVHTSAPAPTPSGYCGTIYIDSVNDFSVGRAVKLHADSNAGRQVTHVSAIQGLGTFDADGPNPENIDECAVDEVVIKSHGPGRVAGWIGMSIFLFTGPEASAYPALRSLRVRGSLDLPPPKGLPVLDGVPPP